MSIGCVTQQSISPYFCCTFLIAHDVGYLESAVGLCDVLTVATSGQL